MGTTAGTAGISVRGPRVERQDEVLTPDALGFLAELHRRFGARRQELLARRQERRAEAARTGQLDFLTETREIREDASWTVATAPGDLTNRRVEITGPTERKMLVNAMNSGAQVCLTATG
jgi:malate synthase